MTRFLLVFVSALFFWLPASAAPKVVVSIKPIHSLVAAVMEGAASPTLLLDGQTSPHDATLRPSQAGELQEADLIFWVGHDLETFLEKPLESLSNQDKLVSLIDLEGLHFPEKSDTPDDDHDEDDKDDDHEDDDDHHHHDRDPHIWLDPENALIMLKAIEQQLARIDVKNAKLYAANSAKTAAKIRTQITTIDSRLQPYRQSKFLTFHSAYGHFSNRFKLTDGSAITTNPEQRPSAARISELRAEIKSNGIDCIFSEPQFDTRLVSLLTEGTETNSAVLDPMASSLPKGPDHYQRLIGALTRSFVDCMAAK